MVAVTLTRLGIGSTYLLFAEIIFLVYGFGITDFSFQMAKMCDDAYVRHFGVCFFFTSVFKLLLRCQHVDGMTAGRMLGPESVFYWITTTWYIAVSCTHSEADAGI
ncbi:MAG: hypothetical protein MZV64_09185 [Ignavibacteriales bacterium]|nr:hypothetical protein [Ignavibacteriales bacterium]